MSGAKRKRNVLNAKQKLEILQKLDNGESASTVAEDVLNEGNTISHSAALQSVETLLDYMGQRGFDYGDITAPARGKTEDALYCAVTLNIAPHIRDNILVQWLRYHIFSFRQGKKKFIIVLNSTELQQIVNIFRDENACPDDIDEAGQKVLIALYGGKNREETFDYLRFKLFQKSLVKNNFNLASFPPITAAAREPFLRVYLHVQLWSRFAKSSLDWGWKETKHGLFSVATHKKPDPPPLLSMISCKCAKWYNLTCTCRKAGMKCSTVCYHCKGKGFANSPEDNIIANSVNQEAEIDIRMEKIISELTCRKNIKHCKWRKVAGSKPTLMILTHLQHLKNLN
ncbi:hypothetical protein AVEN_146469-1 [Araneus ventricosus]|uniref:Uncharacterized protein n=1 Tax=Araneus ventricosus TaxID=182803 RepID=A0A4Y2K3R6_ARAVE|nr:hypothetical protein AVEN_146469-1 [Araneus ventricosus]